MKKYWAKIYSQAFKSFVYPTNGIIEGLSRLDAESKACLKYHKQPGEIRLQKIRPTF